MESAVLVSTVVLRAGAAPRPPHGESPLQVASLSDAWLTRKGARDSHLAEPRHPTRQMRMPRAYALPGKGSGRLPSTSVTHSAVMPDAALDTIAARRTIKDFTGAPVPRTDLERLLVAAMWAPNHHLTQPWRFFIAEHARVPDLVAAVQRPPIADTMPAERRAPIIERLARCGAVVLVVCRRVADPLQQREDRDAVAAAVQNLLLAAHALGYGSYWSTNPLMTHPETLRWFGADPTRDDHVATVWLGVPARQPPPPRRRPVADVCRWV